jgi:HAD superfamily hydrolase (TIGR01509 family)
MHNVTMAPALTPKPMTPSAAEVKALLFDFDGTLWDSESLIFAIYEEIFLAFGQALSHEVWWSFMGTIGFDAWARLEALAEMPIDRLTADLQVNRRKDELLSQATARPGVKRYLTDADALGLRRAIVSNSSRPRIARYARQCGVGDGWHAVQAAEGDRSRAKPNPDLYSAALAMLGVHADEAVAFEDCACGVSAAKAAGLRCVAVPNPVTDRSALGAADLMLESFEQMSLSGVLAALGLNACDDVLARSPRIHGSYAAASVGSALLAGPQDGA